MVRDSGVREREVKNEFWKIFQKYIFIHIYICICHMVYDDGCYYYFLLNVDH